MDAQHGKHGSSSMAVMHEGQYRKLGVMALLSFVAMYMLMYSMVDRFDHVYNNLNQVYMAGLMAAPMVLIELLLMRAMYTDMRRNVIIAAAALILGVVCFMAVRQQGGIGDRQFLRSMIPHHASAILMCEQAAITDPRIKSICDKPNGILESQRREIDEMTAILATTPAPVR